MLTISTQYPVVLIDKITILRVLTYDSIKNSASMEANSKTTTATFWKKCH